MVTERLASRQTSNAEKLAEINEHLRGSPGDRMADRVRCHLREAQEPVYSMEYLFCAPEPEPIMPIWQEVKQAYHGAPIAYKQRQAAPLPFRLSALSRA